MSRAQESKGINYDLVDNFADDFEEDEKSKRSAISQKQNMDFEEDPVI